MGFLTREFNQPDDFSGPVIPGSNRPRFVDSSLDKNGKSRHGETSAVFTANRILGAFRKVKQAAERFAAGDAKTHEDYDQFYS